MDLRGIPAGESERGETGPLGRGDAGTDSPYPQQQLLSFQ